MLLVLLLLLLLVLVLMLFLDLLNGCESLRHGQVRTITTRGICSVSILFFTLDFGYARQQIGRHSAPVCIGFVLWLALFFGDRKSVV